MGFVQKYLRTDFELEKKKKKLFEAYILEIFIKKKKNSLYVQLVSSGSKN